MIKKRIGSAKPNKDEYIKKINCLKKGNNCKKLKNLCPIFVEKCILSEADRGTAPGGTCRDGGDDVMLRKGSERCIFIRTT